MLHIPGFGRAFILHLLPAAAVPWGLQAPGHCPPCLILFVIRVEAHAHVSTITVQRSSYRPHSHVYQVLNGDYNLPPGRPEPLLDLIRGLLKVSPAQRLDIDAVLHRLERMSSKLSIRAASSGPPSVPSRATSNGNAARMPRTSAGGETPH